MIVGSTKCMCIFSSSKKGKNVRVYVRRAWIIVNSHSMLYTMLVYVYSDLMVVFICEKKSNILLVFSKNYCLNQIKKNYITKII